MDLSKATAEYLAEFHFHDQWEVKNYKKCIEHLELMTKNGEADTSLLWGMCYRDGLGVKKDKAKAKQYFDSVWAGSTVYFGINYETHKMLKCKVLEIKDGTALLQTEHLYKFPTMYKHNKLITPNGPVSSWLNDKSDLNGFIYRSFTKPEQKRLVETLVTTPDNPYCPSGWKQKDVKVKVFLQSLQEYLELNGLSGMSPKEGRWTLMMKHVTTDYMVGGYRSETIHPREIPFRYFGELPDKNTFEDATCIYTRTPGEKKGDLCFVINDIVFPQGSNYGTITYTDVKIAYQPVFRINLE